MKKHLPKCPDKLPDEIVAAAKALACAYAASPIRPQLSPDVVKHWDELVQKWSDDPTLPLFIRKQSADIGSALSHIASGRILAPCDNSPAHWAIRTAFERGNMISLTDVRNMVTRHEIPVTMAMSKADVDASDFKGALSKQESANDKGWKLDHIGEVGLKSRLRIQDMNIDLLKRHFCKLMSPSNMVLVPTVLKGLGDMPIFLHVIKTAPKKIGA